MNAAHRASAQSAVTGSYPSCTAQDTNASAPRSAESTTATLPHTSADGAKGAGPCFACAQETPVGTAAPAEQTEQAPTVESAPLAGARLYPATRMAQFTATERVLTTPEDLSVTRRATSDTNRQFVKVVSIREIGYRKTYNFDVVGTRNYLVHGGHVVHNCVDSWAWNARLHTLHEPPRRPQRRDSRKDTLEHKLKKLLAAQGGRSRSPMAA